MWHLVNNKPKNGRIQPTNHVMKRAILHPNENTKQIKVKQI